jgi:hypothetical protein
MLDTIKLPVRHGRTSIVVLKKHTFIQKSNKVVINNTVHYRNKNSAFIILDLIYMIKENNMILNEHCHCSTLNTKYVLNEIHIRI